MPNRTLISVSRWVYPVPTSRSSDVELYNFSGQALTGVGEWAYRTSLESSLEILCRELRVSRGIWDVVSAVAAHLGRRRRYRRMLFRLIEVT